MSSIDCFHVPGRSSIKQSNPPFDESTPKSFLLLLLSFLKGHRFANLAVKPGCVFLPNTLHTTRRLDIP